MTRITTRTSSPDPQILAGSAIEPGRQGLRRIRSLASDAWLLTARAVGLVRPTPRYFRIMSAPATAAFIAWLGLFLGVAVSIWGNGIREATRQFGSAVWDRAPRSVDGPTLLFWAGLVVWARLLYLRLITDEEHKVRRAAEMARTVTDLKGAIFRAPNPSVYGRAKKYFDETSGTVLALERAWAAKPEPDEARVELLRVQIQIILEAVVRLVKTFNVLDDERVRYRANIMLLEECRPAEPHPFPQSLVARIKFFDLTRFAEDKLLGMLYIPSALAFPPAEEGGQASIHDVVLPVPHTATADGVRFALPGGPWAFLTGEMSVHEDTRVLAKEWQHVDERARRQLERHFSEHGAGGHVRSFGSFRIGDENHAIGVLNIDSDRTHLLGTDRLYYLTFHTLVGPFIRMLEAPVREYEQRIRSTLFGRASATNYEALLSPNSSSTILQCNQDDAR